MKTMQMANAALLPEVARLVSEGHSVTLPLRGVSMRGMCSTGLWPSPMTG